MSTVGKALDILEAILKQGGEVGLTDLSNTTGLNISTTHRLCSLLVKRGYLCQKSKGEPYSLGLKLLQFNDVKNVAASIKEQAHPFLQRLCNDISETVHMSILNGIEPNTIIACSPKHILLAVLNPVNVFPLHCTSIGKVFLAYMTDERIDNIINIMGLDAYTDNTITDKAQLKKEIENIRKILEIKKK